MKTNFSYLHIMFLALTVTIHLLAPAQGIFQLWGTTQQGGTNNDGIIFFTKYDGTNLQKVDMTSAGGRFPNGKLLLYNGKLYGLARYGGAHNLGTFFEYDLLTKTYTKKVDLNGANGSSPIGGALVALNNKLYGLTTFGGTYDKGVLFEYDPITNTLSKKVEFNTTNGQFPKGGMLVYNNKLYGLTSSGNFGAGAIFEYDPVANIYKTKYEFGKVAGDAHFPGSNLLLYNNKFYCLTGRGGMHSSGTIFEYAPSTGVGTIKHNFLGDVNGVSPSGSLSVYKDKLYGFAAGGSHNYGLLFDFDLITNTFIKRFDYHWNKQTGTYPSGGLAVNNGKLYGITAHDGPTLYEFDPISSSLTVKTKFTGLNGANPEAITLTKVPTPVAAGILGSCQTVDNTVIDATNANDWVPITNLQGDAVAEINANGNTLGTVTTNIYVHNGTVRQDGKNKFYLNRNISITPQFQPTTPVSVRLYIKGAEFNALKDASNASGLFPIITSINNIGVFKNEDVCANKFSDPALPVSGSSTAEWGLYNDYVFTVSVNSFSTFYFASIDYTVLPIQLISFTASTNQNAATLQWVAKEEEDGKYFEVEYSKDGNTFSAIATILTKGAGAANYYQYVHRELANGTHYYRIRAVNQNGSVSYSSIKKIDVTSSSSFQLHLKTNPVVSQATISLAMPKAQRVELRLYSSIGQSIWQGNYNLAAGQHTLTLPIAVPKGYYSLQASSGESIQRVSFVKQ